MRLFYPLLLALLGCHGIVPVGSLRCARSCTFGPVPLGSLDPIERPCETVEMNATVTMCALSLSINFATSTIRGTLNPTDRLADPSSMLDLVRVFMPGRTLTYVSYKCATTDDCDQDFARETVSTSQWFQLNETNVRTEITSLLFQMDPPKDDLHCAHDRLCSWTENCYAERSENHTGSHKISILMQNNFPCNDTSPVEVMFEQHFSAPNVAQRDKLKILCNTNLCNQPMVVEQVYNILQEEFTLPLNYSAYDVQ